MTETTPRFTREQLLMVARLANSEMSKIIDSTAKHVIDERTAEKWPEGTFEPHDYLSQWYDDYAAHALLLQASGSIDDESHTRERFDAAVAQRVHDYDTGYQGLRR